jgi:hypothetical protein
VRGCSGVRRIVAHSLVIMQSTFASITSQYRAPAPSGRVATTVLASSGKKPPIAPKPLLPELVPKYKDLGQ